MKHLMKRFEFDFYNLHPGHVERYVALAQTQDAVQLRSMEFNGYLARIVVRWPFPYDITADSFTRLTLGERVNFWQAFRRYAEGVVNQAEQMKHGE